MVKSSRMWMILAGMTVGVTSGLSAQEAAPVTPEMIAQGKTLYAGAAACQMCHGLAGKGTGMTAPLTDTTWAYAEEGTLEAVAAVIRDGLTPAQTGKMPMPAASAKKLTEEQITALAAYVMSLSKPGS